MGQLEASCFDDLEMDMNRTHLKSINIVYNITAND